MFSIAAINDTDSKNQWEPLAPTKEAQEFHLSQLYHDGLLRLQDKDYEKARELLESVLKDPLVSNAQVENNASDGHLLQLRFLSLKNLASVFLQQGPTYYENALRCYLDAVELDSKDSVVWNQLGTLSCTMGSLSISRWAFEQGLVCSPSNWNCMEKLLEVLIAIGDEVACLSVAKLILTHWPSHSRALHVRTVIEESEPIPFTPRGIDKLEPKHRLLKFPEKRKSTNEDLDNNKISKKSKQNIEIRLSEASWIALAGELLEILRPEIEGQRSGDVRVIVHLPEKVSNFVENNEFNCTEFVNCNSVSDKEEQPQERRSSRLERRRTRRPDKEESESEFSTNKDFAEIVKQYLVHYLIDRTKDLNFKNHSNFSDSLGSESSEVIAFVHNTSDKHGAYHMSHLLLEKIANKSILYHENFSKILELEMVTRHWGKERTPECSLFLSELYYDAALQSFEKSKKYNCMSEASYHLCKVIESVALEFPFPVTGAVDQHPFLLKNSPFFWIRFFWLSARLSLLKGDEEKSQKEFSVALALFKSKMNGPIDSICLPHCKVVKKITVDQVLHEINLIEVNYFLKKRGSEMLAKNMHAECVNVLAPLLLSASDVYFDEGKGFDSIELSALDVLIKSCEVVEPLDFDVYLGCHKRKLQILLVGGVAEVNFLDNTQSLNAFSLSESESKESILKRWDHLVADEVKAISQCASRIKRIINPTDNSNNINISVIGDIQSLLLTLMCSSANSYFAKKSSGPSAPDASDRTEQCYFVDAAIAFCKLQHLNFNVPIKSQIDLVVTIHDMLAEFGICCAKGTGEAEEGTFLKLAIKHLLALDMKLKSSFDQESTSVDHKSKMNTEPLNESHLEKVNREIEKNQLIECGIELTEDEREELEVAIENALDQCFYCLYGLNLRSDPSCEEDLVMHKNTSQGDYQTKEQCADVFQYILPYAKASSRTGLVKLRKVLRTIRKQFPQPPENILAGNAIDKFLDSPELCEDKLLEEAGCNEFLDSTMKIIFSENERAKQQNESSMDSSDPYLKVYRNLYYLIAQAEEISATDKWAGFVLTNEGADFVENNANLFKYDLMYNPLRFESWQKLANIYDEEVDLLLNDGSKQINVLGWRKSGTLHQRVEASRRRSRRCLLMTLALAKTPSQQGEIHELLALVYYDGLQNVVPIYDQRSVVPLKDAEWKIFCQNAMNHFKKAFKHKEDWSHTFYVGKLCEKLGYSHDISFSYYAKAITLNPSAVDPFYRLHASRLKLLCKCGKQDEEALKVVASHSFGQLDKEIIANLLTESGSKISNSELVEIPKFEKIWNTLYSDCLSALQICVEGDLKHFHKARYMLAKGLYMRGDLEKAKEELSFCFKSSRSSFTINMWEIDSMVKKGRRKTPGPSGNKRALEVNLAESSRKFITCIRKYMLFYLKLSEETGDFATLDRAYISLRADKKFSLCLEDIVPVALGRYIETLIASIRQADTDSNPAMESTEHLLDKLFNLFLERVNLWSDICNLPELTSSDLTENSLYGYLFEFIHLLEREVKFETLESISEKIRKRLKNPKLSNSTSAKVYRHVSAAWCRSLVINMVLITPLLSRISPEINTPGYNTLETNQILCVDLQSEELWGPSFEDPNHLKVLENKWNPSLSKIKNVIIKKVSDEDLESAATLLRSAYNFYKDTSCALLPSGVNLYMVPAQLGTETYIQPGIDGADNILDMNTSRKLLLWAYSLLHGHCTNVGHVIKYCEENGKSRMRKGTGGLSTPQSGGIKDGITKNSETEIHPLPFLAPTPLPQPESRYKTVSSPQIEPSLLSNKEKGPNLTTDSLPNTEGKLNLPVNPQPDIGNSCELPSSSVPVLGNFDSVDGASLDKKEKDPVTERSNLDLQNEGNELKKL